MAEDDHWLGYLEEFPGNWTQGESLDDLHDDLSNDRIPVQPSWEYQPEFPAADRYIRPSGNR
jgi:hypothetical protein